MKSFSLGTFRGIFVGVYVLVGVPLFAFTLGQFAGMIVEKAVREREMKIMSRPLGESEFKFALTLKRKSVKIYKDETSGSVNNNSDMKENSNCNSNGNGNGNGNINKDINLCSSSHSSFSEHHFDSGKLLLRPALVSTGIPSRGRPRSFSESHISQTPKRISSKNVHDDVQEIPTFSIDFGEFVVLEMLRLCRVDEDDLKAIRSLFDDIDYDNSGEIDEKKLQKFNDLLNVGSERTAVGNNDQKYDREKEENNYKLKKYSKIDMEDDALHSTAISSSTSIPLSDFTVVELPLYVGVGMRSESMRGLVRVDPSAQIEIDYDTKGGSGKGEGGVSVGSENIFLASHTAVEDDLSRKVSTDEMGRSVDGRNGQGDNDDYNNMAEIQLDSGKASPVNSEGNTVTKRTIFDINRNFQSRMSCDVGSSKSESVASSEESSGARHMQLAEEYNRLLMPILHMRRQSSNLYQRTAKRRKSREIDRGEDRDGEYGRGNSITPPGGRSARQSVTSDTSDDEATSPKPSFWNRFRGWEKGALIAIATGGSGSGTGAGGQELVSDDDIGSYHRDRNGVISNENEPINDVETALHQPHSASSNLVNSLHDVPLVVAPSMLKSFGYSKYGSMNTIEEENI